MYTVIISERAEQDLRDIFLHIAYTLESGGNAEGQLKRLEEAIKKLTEFPERYKKYKSDLHTDRNLRVMPVDNYLVFYVVDTEIQIVNVIRVLYGRRERSNI